MTVVAQLIIEANRTELNRVLKPFTGAPLIVIDSTDPPAHTAEHDHEHERAIEVHTDEPDALKRFHQACCDHDLTVDVQRISRNSTGRTPDATFL